jgi:hypothetical protein
MSKRVVEWTIIHPNIVRHHRFIRRPSLCSEITRFGLRKKNRKEKDENRAALPLIVECEHEEVNKRDSLICFGSPNDDAQYAAIPLLGLRVPTDGAQ